MATARGFFFDDETGELVTYGVNEETGEPMVNNPTVSFFGTPRPIPPMETPNFPEGPMSQTKKFQALKENIIAGSNPISHRMLLFPSVMIFPELFCVLLLILEVYLHVKCHKKNKKLKDQNLYYRSPFHVVTSTFCGACRESELASRIGQMQDKRRNRYDYFRGIAI
ncbi:uncharacterized protein LOC114246077 [Bombyx mandarina]|uniref:Uncharacterized protein n=2 Tax=Bombyx TaxID=7090 RepID=A0A8R1WPA3_BOMMO|nr:uncharacterized protein LOC101736593 [Bombyx mori]XP_028034258.1 uncharacterized protein LOC114246077 [Bombyx mandarina]XP_028034264.1 uncharacterized protein LOC114246077 [Bombyx mandarina]